MAFPTAQTAITALVERGDLTETTGRRRKRFYMANGIFDAVYGEVPEPVQPRLFQ